MYKINTYIKEPCQFAGKRKFIVFSFIILVSGYLIKHMEVF